ncbi:sp110 nuclear body protein-like [Trichomycterus rosablanca]|uniref:sp110 nuclear body protein-like n=1 Tax=Trichomycterus rosablanca TaxID=2290929 RepID=UPI002F34F4A5
MWTAGRSLPTSGLEEVIMIDCKDKLQKGVYQILEWVEKNQNQSIKKFWKCVFKNHIRLKYSTMQSLRASLLDGPSAKKVIKSKKPLIEKQKKTANEPGPSSSFIPSPKKPVTFGSYKEIGKAQKAIKKKNNPIQKSRKTPKDGKTNKIKKALPTSNKKNPSAKKPTKSKEPSSKKQKKTANEKTIADLNKELLRKMEKEEPGPSSSFISNQKKPAKNVTTAAGLKPGKTTKEKKTGIKRKKAGEDTEKEKPGPSITVNIKMTPAISQTLSFTKIPGAEKISVNGITADLNHEEMTKEKKTGIKRKNSDKETEEEKPGPSSLVTNKQMKPSMNQMQFSSSKKEENHDMDWSWSLYKTQLHVTCGDKAGMLHQEKLAKGEECILSEGSWYTPFGFEKFAGKGNCKNWKSSIRCQNTTLQKLIESGHLQCAPMMQRTVQKSRTKNNTVQRDDQLQRPHTICSSLQKTQNVTVSIQL